MIALYNTHTKKYLNILTSTKLTFEAENQLQSLENYNIGFSFDIELVNDENSRDAVLDQSYNTGNYYTRSIAFISMKVPIMDHPRVILYNNGVPLYIGSLVQLESSIDTIKCAYKCVPYGGAFNNFEFKTHLYDYLYSTYNGYDQASYQLRDIFADGNFAMSIYGYDYNKNIKSVPLISLRFENNAKNDKAFPSDMYVEDADKGWTVVLDSTHRKYWATFRINSLLKCMNIKTLDTDDDCFIAVPMKISYTRLLKIRMYKNTVRDSKTSFKYKATRSSPIYWLNEHTSAWEKLEAASDNTGVFKNSLRENKALNGLTFKDIQYPPDFKQYGIQGLNTDKGYQSINFGLSPGKTYEDGDDITMHVENVSVLYDKPDYIDATFEYACEVDYPTYSGNKTLYNEIPFMPCDISVFGTETNKFLNELSLNNKYYKWLRNPAYFNNYNYNAVHGQSIASFGMCFLDQSKIEDIKKEISYDQPNNITITTKIGFDTSYTKKLNDTNNDQKEISHNFTGLGVVAVMPNDTLFSGTPPLFWNNKNKEYIDNEVYGCFGKVYEHGNYRSWLVNCNSDYDYVDNYSDKSNKYTITCVGYNFEELVVLEDQYFVVNKYSTSDFSKFELECYPLTDNNTPIYLDPEEDWKDTRGTGGRNGSRTHGER